MGAGRFRSEFPAHDGAMLGIVVPVAEPCVGDDAGRIEFDDLAVTFELTHAVDDDRSLLGGVAVASARTGIHLPLMDRALRTAEPARELGGVGEGLKNARRRC